MLEDILRAIVKRYNHPEEIPTGSYWAAYREDIVTLLRIIEDLQKEIRDERRRYEIR
jgi:hypothetical protein